MISDKQLRANRLNAQKSTGPKTADGKSISSQNATVHGLRSARPVIEGEDPAEYNEFRNDMITQFAPAGPMETLLVNRIVQAAWRLRRIGAIEVELYDFIRRPPEDDQDKLVKAKVAESAGHVRQYGKLVSPPQNRFGSFDEAMRQWLKTKDGQMYAQNKWPTDPGYPKWFEAFDDFKKPQEPGTVSEFEGIETSNIMPEKASEPNGPDQCRPADRSLSLGRAVANDFKDAGLLTRLSRYETAIERSMFKNLRQLQDLQQERAK